MLNSVLQLISTVISSDLFHIYFVIFLTETIFLFIYLLSHGGRF